ncbi:hypothetical protein THIOKS11830003 [Thiocapsa sp. KS1]|nr:hypothetical protein THIOKS11830003 [Thiocapsa sp. KS1]
MPLRVGLRVYAQLLPLRGRVAGSRRSSRLTLLTLVVLAHAQRSMKMSDGVGCRPPIP